jgi:hypothetical protein
MREYCSVKRSKAIPDIAARGSGGDVVERASHHCPMTDFFGKASLARLLPTVQLTL